MARSAYVGKAGQLAVMAEYLMRGYNVAMPEVDEGDDVFVEMQGEDDTRESCLGCLGVEVQQEVPALLRHDRGLHLLIPPRRRCKTASTLNLVQVRTMRAEREKTV